MKIEFREAAPQEFTDNRSSERFTGSGGEVTFQTDEGEQFQGVVVNESFGGAGIVFDDTIPLPKDTEVDVVYHGVSTEAIVRHVTSFAKGGCMVGVHWKASALEEQVQALQQLKTRPDLNLADALSRFIDLLPGGAQLMCRLHDNQRWAELSEAIDRLAQDAAAANIRGTDDCLTVLVHLLEDDPDHDEVRKAVDNLVSRFVEKATAAALETREL